MGDSINLLTGDSGVHPSSQARRWTDVVVQQHQDAVARWSADHPFANEPPRFWELSLDLDENVLNDAARAVAYLAKFRHVDLERPSALFFLYVLRTRLTNVHGSYLWPAFAKELELRAAIVDPDVLGAFYREVLRRLYGNRLAEIDHHNRYVYFALDEAGVGWNRSAIVRDFLESLLVGWQSDPTKPHEVLLRDTLARSLAGGHARSDVDALYATLLKAGSALLLLAEEVRDSALAVDMPLMDWISLRDLMFGRTGIDFDRVLPEARSAFGDLVPRLGDRMSRQTLTSLIRGRSYSVTAPAGVDLQVDVPFLPLMPVSVSRRGISKHLTVTDEYGLASAHVLGTRPDAWHPLGSTGIFLWRKNPFTVDLDARATEPSVPVYAGQDPATAVVSGHFWSGPLSSMPRTDGVADPAFPGAISSRWTATDEGLVLTVAGVRTPYRFSGRGTLTVDGTGLWRGDIASGVLLLSDPVRLIDCAQRPPALAVTVLDSSSGQRILQTSITNVSGVAVLAADGRPLQPGTALVSVSGSAALNLFLRADQPDPAAQGCRLQRCGDVPSWPGFKLWRIQTSGGRTDISAGGLTWSLSVLPPLALESTAAESLDLGGLTVTGEGAVPVRAGDPLPLRIAGLSPDSLRIAAVLSAHLRLRTPTRTYRWRLGEFRHRLSDADSLKLDLRLLAGRSGITLPDGVIRIDLEGAGCEDQVRFFLVPWTTFKVLPSRIGETSQIQLLRSDETFATLSGAEAVPEHVVTTNLDIPGVRMALAWRPWIRDARLACVSGNADEVGLRDLASGTTIRLSGGSDWIVRYGSRALPATADSTVEVADLLVDDADTDGTETLEALDHGELVRTWKIDLTPLDVRISAAWEGVSLKYECHWLGMDGQRVEVRLMQYPDTLLAPAQAYSGRSNPGVAPRNTAGSFSPPLGLMRAGMAARAAVVYRGRELASCSLAPPPRAGGTEDFRRDVILVLSQVRDRETATLAARQALRLSERHLVARSSMPVRAEALLPRLQEAEGIVRSSLRLLESLASGDVSLTPDIDLSGEPEDRLPWLTLCLIAEMRLQTEGLARRVRFQQIRNGLARLRVHLPADAAEAAWCAALEAVTGTFLGEPAGATAMCKRLALESPLIAFDDALLSRIGSLETLEVDA